MPQPRVVEIDPEAVAFGIVSRVEKLYPVVLVAKRVDLELEVTKNAVKAEADEEAI